jgi:hypothetical protein
MIHERTALETKSTNLLFIFPYTFGITLILILSQLDFSIIQEHLLATLEVLAFLAACTWIVGILRSSNDLVAILGAVLVSGLSLFIPNSLVQAYSLGGLLIFTFFRKVSPNLRSLKIVFTCASIVSLSLALLGSVLGDGFVSVNIIQSLPNSANTHQLVARGFDAGATGGSTSVTIDRIYFGLVRQKVASVYNGGWNEHPKIEWIDNETVRVEGNEYDIQNGKKK